MPSLDVKRSMMLLVTSLILSTYSSMAAPAPRQSDDTLELKYRLEEEPDIGTYVGDVRQDTSLTHFYDADVLQQLQFRFLRQPQQQQQMFAMDGATGVIRTSGRVDRDFLCPGAETCLVKLDVAVQPAQYFRIIRVTIAILDINDNAPRFPEAKLHFEILESAAIGTGLVIPKAIDPDSPDFAVRGYRELTDSNTFRLPEIRKSATQSGSHAIGELRLDLCGPLDREVVDRYRIKIMVADGGVPPRTGIVDVTIDVVDVNDNSPVFEKNSYEVSVPENVPPRTILTKLTATDADIGLNGQVVYELSSLTASSYGNIFAVSNSTGEVYVVGLIDYEHQPVYNLVIVARDLGADSIPASVSLTVKVTDVNDNAPEISIDALTGSSGIAVTSEDAAVDTFVAHVAVSDKDTGSAGRVECFVNDGHFRLKPMTNNVVTGSSEYQLVTAASLDRELQSVYEVGIVCRDMGPESRVSVEKVQVRVTDVNDNDPQFRLAQYRAELIENNYVGAVVLTVNATDPDEGDNGLLVYSLDESGSIGFRIEPESGVIKAMQSFDREVGAVYKLNVLVHDSVKIGRRSSVAEVVVEIIDVNDCRPQFTKDQYSFVVEENTPGGTVVGKVIAIDNDSGPHGHVIYSMTSELFTIDRQSGRIQTSRSLDRELQSVHHVTVVASDLGVPPIATSCEVTIHVGDVNDNPPVFDRHTTDVNATYLVSTRARPGHVITRLRTRDSDVDGNARVMYELTSVVERFLYDDRTISASGLFDIDPLHGALRVTGNLADYDGSTYEIVVTARDDGTPSLSAAVHIYVIVNSSVVETLPTSAEGRRSSLTKHNLIVVIALALISGLVTVCLVVAIVFTRRGGADKRRKCKPKGDDSERKYQSSMESTCAPPIAISHDNMDDTIHGTFKPPEVTFCKEPETKSHPTADNYQGLYKVESGHQKNWHCNQLIQRLKNVDILDGVSLQSNEDGSNTDSGRGPSEVDGLLPVDMHSASRLSPSRPSYITGTVPTVTVVPIKPCLVTDSSRLANHVGHPLSTVPEDYSCSETSIDRLDNRCHGNGVSFQGYGGLGHGRLGPSILSKNRRTASASRQYPRLTIENEHSAAANDCPSLSRSPRRAEPLPPKLRIISDEYDDYEDRNTGDGNVTTKATGSYAPENDGDQVPSAYYHPLGVRLTTV